MKLFRLLGKAAALLCSAALLAGTVGAVGCKPQQPQKEPEYDINYADVFIFMGQSNMAGRGEARDAIPCGDGHGYEFRAASGSDEKGWLYPVEEPFGNTENNEALSDGVGGDGKKTGGVVSAFCESYYQQTKIPVIAVSASVGATSITQWTPGTQYYNEAVRRLTACIDYLKADGDFIVRNINMVWCQGCSDAGKVAEGKLDYVEKLTSIVDGMRGLGGGKGIKNCFIITLSEYSDGKETESKAELAKMQEELCETDERFTLASVKFRNVPAEMRDDPHFHQGIYNVAGWDAGKNVAQFITTGKQAECKPYEKGEAEALAAKFEIDLLYKEYDAPVPPDEPAPPAQPQEVDVFIFMGQSNMAGRGEAADAIPCAEGHGYEFRAVGGNNKDGWLYPVEEPFGNTENNAALNDGVGGDGNKSGGVVSAFCESYYRQTGVPAVGVSASVGGSSIYHWSPTSTSYNYFNEAARRLTACVDYLTASQSFTVRHINMVWCQGCSDAGQVANGKINYVNSLKKIVTAMKSLGAGKSIERCFIITLSEYSGGAISENKVKLAGIQEELCKTDEDFALASIKFRGVPAEMRDDPHFHQGIYNVAGWDAGKNVAQFITTGKQAECKPYEKGEAAALAATFGIDLKYKETV